MNYPMGGYPPPQWPQGGYPPNPYMMQGMPPPQRKSGRGGFIALGVIVAFAGLCGVAAFFGNRMNEENEANFGPLRAACGGVAVPGARPYAPGPAGHRMVALERGSSGDLRFNQYALPQGARGEHVADSDLVVCLGDEQRAVVGSCTVTSRNRGFTSTRDYDQVQLSRTVRVVAAATGQLVAQGAVQGSAPRACTGFRFGSSSASDYVGGSPDTARLAEFFQQNGLGTY